MNGWKNTFKYDPVKTFASIFLNERIKFDFNFATEKKFRNFFYYFVKKRHSIVKFQVLRSVFTMAKFALS